MARVVDLFRVCRVVGPVELGKRLYVEINNDNVFTNAAAMAYAWVFAVFPLLIFLMTLVPHLPKEVRDVAPDKLAELLYRAGMTYAIVGPIQDTIRPLLNDSHGGLLSIGLLLTLYAASGGMNTTMASLDAAFDVEKPRPFLLKRLIAIVLTVFMGVAFFIVLLLLPIGSIITALLTTYVDHLPGEVRGWMTTKMFIVATAIRYAIGLSILQIMIGVLYQFGPSKRQPMRFFTAGSIFTMTGWIITGFALRFYFSHFNSYSKTYGTVAGMVIMLMVFYLDAAIILIGAELDAELTKERNAMGIRIKSDRDQTSVASTPNPAESGPTPQGSA